jgi:hypothetical protein
MAAALVHEYLSLKREPCGTLVCFGVRMKSLLRSAEIQQAGLRALRFSLNFECSLQVNYLIGMGVSLEPLDDLRHQVPQSLRDSQEKANPTLRPQDLRKSPQKKRPGAQRDRLAGPADRMVFKAQRLHVGRVEKVAAI